MKRVSIAFILAALTILTAPMNIHALPKSTTFAFSGYEFEVPGYYGEATVDTDAQTAVFTIEKDGEEYGTCEFYVKSTAYPGSDFVSDAQAKEIATRITDMDDGRLVSDINHSTAYFDSVYKITFDYESDGMLKRSCAVYKGTMVSYEYFVITLSMPYDSVNFKYYLDFPHIGESIVRGK